MEGADDPQRRRADRGPHRLGGQETRHRVRAIITAHHHYPLPPLPLAITALTTSTRYRTYCGPSLPVAATGHHDPLPPVPRAIITLTIITPYHQYPLPRLVIVQWLGNHSAVRALEIGHRLTTPGRGRP